MNLDKRIKRTRKRLNQLVATNGVMDKRVLPLSQELDHLIVARMRRRLA